MDFQKFVDGFGMVAAVLSVEDLGDGHWGEIRIHRFNEMYKKIMGNKVREDMIYYELIPKEPNFEDFCYRCAVHKQHLHAYVDTKAMGLWTDGTYIPMSPEWDHDNICYFLFFFEFTKEPEAARMSNLSLDSAPFVIQTCIKLRGAENYYEAMNNVIADIQKQTDSFCSAIFMIDKDKHRFAPLCSKFRNDQAKIEDYLPYLTNEVVFSWEKMLLGHDSFFVKDEYDMDELMKLNPVWGKSLKAADVKSVILVPLMQGKKFIGSVFITNFDTDKFVEIKEFLTLTAFFLSAEISNNDLMERLEFMSNVDFLTGVKNRNSMNARVDWFVSGVMDVKLPYGVVFADLNGLKQCNDKGGHEAGDVLLKNAAKLLNEVFGKYEVYRAGGDEFVVIAPGCQKNEFDELVRELREKSDYGKDVCFALGTKWTENAKDLRECMHLADEAMYADKAEFYKKHPDIARRS